ncbi:winged helix-turn-helix transcriptional regulator [Paenibacillus qinlingensis]|uniref:winged helix-turn-helix transcriptional regulator n=1 Tax=Paenibacillus qinlingensis TaxID=1837343 RepID=UPI001566855C|nr:helix-turn-helix domain-containing protein [Paenibacillus qinlingensis]NQX58002.1 helix-turn-helix transcriptional regulator [Paenibacillus qinlingensis]
MPVQLNECPVEVVFAMLSGRWKIPIYRYLYKNDKPVRYSELLRHLPSISKKILTEQLRELERDGIVERKSYPEPRPRVEYMMSSSGRSMIVFLDKMSEWGEEHIFSNKIEYSSPSVDISRGSK